MARGRRKKGKGGINKGIIYILVGMLGLAGGYSLFSYEKGPPLDPSELRGGETKPVLSSAYFVGQTARTYRIAKEIPEVLDSLYCYCHCKRTIGHKSLLSCFTDQHAAYCDICQEEAIRAYELYKKGEDILSIRKAIDKEFGV